LIRYLLLDRLGIIRRNKLDLALLNGAKYGLINFLAIIMILCTDWLYVEMRVNDH
jgi:hypothetical protein